MSLYQFDKLELENWKLTRNKIQSFAQLLSDIKGKYSSHNKNWEEFSLKIYAKGLTTTPVPVLVKNKIEALDLNLNFIEHKLKIFLGRERLRIDLNNQSVKSFAEEVTSILNNLGVEYNYPKENFSDEINNEYDVSAVENYWNSLIQVYFIFQEFEGTLLEETSSINFWAHHFDLSMLWFSGRLIPEQDPTNWDNSRQQMNFGFSTGDAGISEPYFYITAYPFPEKILETKLTDGAYWHTEGWNGAVMKYSHITEIDNAKEKLLKFFDIILSARKDLIT